MTQNSGAPRPPSRVALIEAAERLFAERGTAGVSLREIAVAAGQRNHSAVVYQFGSRRGLVEAAFDHRMARIEERRRAMLAAQGPQPGVRDLLEALVAPVAESIGHDNGASWHVRFLRQVVFEPGFDVFAPARLEVSAGLRTVIGGLSRHLAVLPGPVRGRRLLQVWQMMVHSLADHEAQLAHGAVVMPTPLLVADLVDCAEAVLAAPVSNATAKELDRVLVAGA